MFLSDVGIFDEGEYVSFDARGTRVLEKCDSNFLAFLENREVQSVFIPALIKGHVLSKCGYFESFPHQIMTVGTLSDEHWNRGVATGELQSKDFVLQNCYLTPAACLHVYPMFQDRPSVSNSTVTNRARVYRHETRKSPPLMRLWDFTVREFVFLGDAGFVRESLELTKEKALSLARDEFSDVEIVPANDDFYPNPLNNVKMRVQRGNMRKFELIARVAGHSVALASFNFHDIHFSAAFNFDNDRHVVTGCAGFGLERWVGAKRMVAVDH